jgi:hypothetical protein
MTTTSTRRTHNLLCDSSSIDEIIEYVMRPQLERRANADRSALSAACTAYAEHAETLPTLTLVAAQLHAVDFINAALAGAWNMNDVAKIIWASPYTWDSSMSAAEQEIGNTCYWADFTSRPHGEAAALLALLPKRLRQ